MAKNNNIDINERIKKKMPDNEWFSNVGKSLGFTTMDIVTGLLPNTSDAISWNSDSIKKSIEFTKNVKKNNGVRNMFSKQIKNLPQIKILEQAKKNALADIKSGKFYNKDRVVSGDFNDGEDFGFDDDLFGDVDVQFLDDEGDVSEVSADSTSQPPIAVINTMPLAKAMQASTGATIETMNAIAGQQMAIENEKMILSQQSLVSLTNGLNAINDNLALLVEFNSDSTAKFHAAALKYYEQSIEMMNNSEKEDKRKKYKEFLDPFTSTGALKLDEYVKVVKQNLANIKDDNAIIGSMIDSITDPTILQQIAASPGMFIPEVIKGFIPKMVKSTFKDLDDNLSSIIPAILAKVSSFEDSDIPLLNSINKIFGYNPKISKDVDLGDYEKGAIQWDGESKKALVDVIPSYLRRIESALTGDDERIFDYKKGNFDNQTNIKKRFDNQIKESETSGYTGLKIEAKELARKFNLSEKAFDQFENDLEEYLTIMTNKGKMIKPRIYNTNEGILNDEFSNFGIAGNDPHRQEFLRKILLSMNKKTLTEAWTTGIRDSVANTQRIYEDRKNDATYATLYNDTDEDGKIRFNYNKLKDGVRDAFGLSNLDYLRDIRSILIRGIKVFPDNRKRFRDGKDNPNKDFLLKEEYEEQQRVVIEQNLKKEKNKNERILSNEGNSIEDYAFVSNNEWLKSIDKQDFVYDENTKTGRSMKKIKTLSNTIEDKVFEILMGDEDYIDRLVDKYNKRFVNDKPIFENIKEMFGDTSKAVMSYFTGQPYVTSDGVVVEGNENSVFRKISSFFVGTMDKLKGKADDGVIGKFVKDISEGFNKFKVSLFGEKAISEQDGKKTHTNIMQMIKERLPKAIGYGYGSAVVKTFFASKLGVLGNFLLPGGGLSAALIGTAYGFLKQSETYNRIMFGKLDENGERTGGIISKAWQDKYKENAKTIKTGLGIGLLGSLFLPGGPVLGGIVGIGASFASKNEAFQEFLYGKDFKNDEKKSMMNGAFGKVFKKMSGDHSDPQLTKFLGASGLGIGIAQGVGLLPSFLLPGGPIMGAILGLAGGIAASSDKFQEFLLGEKDIDGQRYGGLLHKVTNWFDITFARPLAIKMTEMNDKIYGFMRKKVFDPIARSFEPMIYAVKNMAIDIKNGIVDAFSKVTNPIVEAFKDHVIKPIGKILKKTIVDPIKWIFKKTFGLIGKSIIGVLSAPLGIIGGLGTMAERYNERAVVRHEKRRRGKEFDKNYTGSKLLQGVRRKQAEHISKEEKEELLNEKLGYRDGKTRRERKKEQKKNYKEEMAQRKEKRDAMIKQYEEDKKFAKDSGFKYRSKKQKEIREQQLKEKEAWVQEQTLLQTRETGEKVANISDNVIKFPEQQVKVVNKLDEVKNTLKEGFNNLANKFVNATSTGKDDNTVQFEDLMNKTVPKKEIKESKYGEVTDDHLNAIYDFLDEKNKRKPIITNTDSYKNYGKVEEEHLQPIRDFLDGKPEYVGDPQIDVSKISDPDLKSKLDAVNKKYKKGRKYLKNYSNVIDLQKYLQDNDRSHADGLDKVPTDGYVAELHKGEMVVPEKQAGALRKVMDKVGNGFKGITDVLSEKSEQQDDTNIDETENKKGLLDNVFNGLTGITGMMQSTASIFGKLGGMIFGHNDEKKDRADNALGLTESEENRLKELQDMERREKVSRKGVDFVQEKIAERKKAKEEREWKERLINAIKSVGLAAGTAAGAGLNLFDMLKNGISNLLGGMGNIGSILSSLAIPLGVAGLISAGNNYTKSEEYIQGRTDSDGTIVSDDYHIQKYRTLASARDSIFTKPIKTIKSKLIDPAMNTGKVVYDGVKNVAGKVYNSKMGEKFLQPIGNKVSSTVNAGKEFLFGKSANTADNVIDFASTKTTKSTTSKLAGKNVGKGKVVNLADTKLLKDASGSSKAVKKAIGEGASSVASKGGLINQVVDLGKQALKVLADKAVEKFPKATKLASKLLQLAEPIFKTLLKNADSILVKFAKKITTFLAKLGIGTGTLFIADAVFAIGDIGTGLTAGNAGNLFGVSPENVDARMRIISALIQTVFNFNIMAIISLINEITNMMFNYNFLRNIAIWLYNLTGGEQSFTSRITSSQIDKCKSIEEALTIMGLSNEEMMMLQDGGTWVDFSEVENEDLGGVISASEQMELARLQYNLANGTSLNSQAWIDKESKTVGAKVMDFFKGESSTEKIKKYQSKADTKYAKADEYKQKAEESNNIFSKAWNNSMAWLNEKSAKKADKKIEKTTIKSAKKKAKAEEKVDYHTQKAETSTGIMKWYHEKRANANKKKVTKYTINDNGVVVENNASDVSTSTKSPAIDNAMSPETFKNIYGNVQEGKTLTDGYGNVYDHNGNVIQDGDGNFYDSNGNLLEDSAGMGYGENDQNYYNITQEKPNKNKLTVADRFKGTVNKLKEFGSNPLEYSLNSMTDLTTRAYNNTKQRVTGVANFAGGAINSAKNWATDNFGGAINSAKNWATDKFGFVTEGVDSDNSVGYNIGRVMGNIYNEIDEKRDEIINNVKEAFNTGLEKITGAFTWFKDEFPKKIEEGVEWLGDLCWNKIPEKIGEGIEWAGKKIDEGVNWFKNELPKKIGEVKDNFVNGVKNMIGTVTSSVSEKIEDMKAVFSKDNVTNVFSEKVEDVKDAWGNFTSSITGIFDDIKKSFKLPSLKLSDLTVTWSDIKSLFTDMLKGFKDAGSSGPNSNDYVKPVQHNISSAELLKPIAPSTPSSSLTNTNNNKFVFYSQSDNRWSSDVIGNRTMKDAGCGPTSLAMAISQLTGEQITPDTIAKLGKEHLPGYSQFSLFPSVADKLNMNYNEGDDSNFIVSNLRKGIPVVLSGRTNATGTPYTNEGHVVTASHMSGSNVFIQDPRGESYSRYYPLSSILTGLNKGMIVTPSSTTNVKNLSSGEVSGISLDNNLYHQDLGALGDHGEYISLNEDLGKTGASQVTVADKVLSYARAFLANTSKFKYSQAQNKTTGRYGIDNNNIGADCSSFVSHVLTKAGDAGKVSATSQVFWDSVGTKVSEPQIGDVVCQKGHVGLYSGDGNYIHMSGRKHGIKESKAIQRGNNPHRGYKRVLKNPGALVDPTVVGGNSLLGTVVATSSGNPVTGSSGEPVTTTQGSVPETELFGPFAEMEKIANNMIASIYNGKEVDLYAVPETTNTSNISSGGTVDISGETDTAKAVYKFLTGKGYTSEAACGILGNMEQESGVNPKSIQGNGRGPAAGICQWENYNKKSARWKGLNDYAKSKGKDWTDLQTQLEWLDKELQGGDSTTLHFLKSKGYGGYEGFKQITDINKATLAFEECFERAGKPNMKRRYSAAKSYYDRFGSAGAGYDDGAGHGFAMATSAESAPSGSIPTSMNGWAYYDQNDPKWQEDINNKRIGPSGCGMASHAMMLTTMFGKQVTPVTVGKWARKTGYWGNGGMSWSMPNAVANKLGLSITRSNTNGNGLGNSDLSNIKDQIKSGRPVILSGRGKRGDKNSPFTSGGHIVLAVGVDGSGNLIINDPRGTSYTKAYTDSGVLNSGVGLRGYWAFDKTTKSSLPEDWSTGDYTNTSNINSSTTTGGTVTSNVPQYEPMGVFAKMGNIATNMVSSIFNNKDLNGDAGSGGDGNTYMISPKATYNKSIDTGTNNVDINKERELENISKKVNVAVSKMNSTDVISYTEILKLIMQELQAINNNTAATASGIGNIEIVSANTPISNDSGYSNTSERYNGTNEKIKKIKQQANSSTGYQNARQIAGYKK